MTRATKNSTAENGNLQQSLLSLAIFLHVFVIGTALVANVRRSALERRFLSAVAPYVESLGFISSRSLHFYTHGDVLDDDHFLEIEVTTPAGKVTERFPSEGSNWTADKRRGNCLAQRMGILVEEQDDNLTAVIARSLAVPAMKKHETDKAVVRCVRRLTQPLHLEDLLPEYPRDSATAAAYDRKIYEADIYRDEDGMVQVAKRSSGIEVAPRQKGN